MNHEELKQVLDDHKLWLDDPLTGKRADLRGANLWNMDLSEKDLRYADFRCADLCKANLRNADFRYADFCNADFSQCKGVNYAQVSFTGHGECGRQLLGIVIGNVPRYFCGCFSGTEEQLQYYIEKGEENYKPSRTRAFEFVKQELINNETNLDEQ